MKIVLVRHGETNENAARCYLGHYDAKLNENGRRQLRFLAEKVKKIEPKPTTIFSSDLSRAVESAQIIGTVLQLDPMPEFPLRELDFGAWDCKTYDSIVSADEERFEKWISDPFTVAPPNGETLFELGKRFDQWFHVHLSKTAPNETILIVSHGGPLRWFLSKWVKGDAKQFWKVEGIGQGKGMIADYNERTKKFTLLNTL